MDLRMDGKVVLLTGGSRNIGAAAVELFGESGATVVTCARDEGELESVAARVRASTGATVMTVAMDLSQPEAPHQLAEAALERFGRVDTFVHNAFYNQMRADADMLRITSRQWELSFRLNVTAPYEIAQRVIPGMVERGEGSIVTVLSTACFSVLPPYAAYAASKAGLWQLTRYLAVGCAPSVRVNAVCPGTTPVDTDDERTDWARLLTRVPLARPGRALDSARAILFLASDAAAYTTGQVLFADGGRASLGHFDPGAN